MIVEGLLIAAALAFAVSIGAHYTGACMGMPYAAGAIRSGSALLLMAPLALLGATFASGGVETTVGHAILATPALSLGVALGIVVAAFSLTSLYNVLRIPTSTIQILVFSAVGGGLGDGIPVEWGTIGRFVVLWAIAPFAAFAIAFVLVRLADRTLAPEPATGPKKRSPATVAVVGLVVVGSAASFAMGGNDVANASGAFLMTGLFGLAMAGLVGGIGLALGILTWGRPLLERVAFEIVRLTPRTAVAAQLGQVLVILAYVAFGYFTSMNQALVGAMIGTGMARREPTVLWKPVRAILAGWAAGPASGIALGFVLTWVLRSVHAT